MTTDIVRGSSTPPLDKPVTSPLVRWLLGLFFVALGVLLLAIMLAAIFAARMWAEDRAAAKQVIAEVARVEAAGYPMSSPGLYQEHQAAAGVLDSTPAWLAAMKLATGAIISDGNKLAYVGSGDPALLKADSADSQLTAAQKFLTRYDAALQATLQAAEQPGECRFAFAFERGFSGLSPRVHDVRALVRLLALDVHVKAVEGKDDEALKSLLALYAASDALSQQLTVVEQEIRLATLGRALDQTELVLNELSLTDGQLECLQQRLSACDIEGSFRRSLIGERAMGYQGFQQVGTIGRWSDCQKYLEVMERLIAFSGEGPAVGRQHAQTLLAGYQAEQQGASLWQKNKYIATSRLLPLMIKLFDARGMAIANRDALIAAIAAERSRLKTGRFPVDLAELVPTYVASVPADPFDGQPLRHWSSESELVVYSVGADGKDNGAVQRAPNYQAADIAVRISMKKGSREP